MEVRIISAETSFEMSWMLSLDHQAGTESAKPNQDFVLLDTHVYSSALRITLMPFPKHL